MQCGDCTCFQRKYFGSVIKAGSLTHFSCSNAANYALMRSISTSFSGGLWRAGFCRASASLHKLRQLLGYSCPKHEQSANSDPRIGLSARARASQPAEPLFRPQHDFTSLPSRRRKPLSPTCAWLVCKRIDATVLPSPICR
jgi:hypothetical protein